MQSDQRPIVVVGSINMDLVSNVPHIPRAGETVLGHHFQMHPGGKGANQAVGVARLEYPVKMIGMVGRDAFGKQMLEQLKKEGVDTTHVGEAPAATGIAMIQVDTAAENSIVVAPGANLHLTPEVLRDKKEILRTAGIVLAQLEIPIETVQCLAEICSELHVPLILDPAPAHTLPEGVLNAVTWLTPNETEAQFYAKGTSSDEEMLAMLLRTGVQGVILKRGALGCVLVGSDGVAHNLPAYKVRAVDTTAAGDAFNAAFAVGLLLGYGFVESARFATAAASISVTRSGAQPSLATRKEVLLALECVNQEENSSERKEQLGMA
jgi:ribokinase